MAARKGSVALGADLAITYLNDKAKRFVEPLANELGAPIFSKRTASWSNVYWTALRFVRFLVVGRDDRTGSRPRK